MTTTCRGAATARPPFSLTPIAASLLVCAIGLAWHDAARAQQGTEPAVAPAPAREGGSLPAVRAVAPSITESATGPVEGFVAKRGATATKTDTPIIETPQAISVVTRDQMDAQNVQSVSDALRYAAGVMAEANGPDPRADVATFRGFSAGLRSAYRDGLRDYAFGGQGGVVVEPYGLERIEVLRGPASVLYGQGDAGGIINLVSKRPTGEPLHELQVQLGSYNRKQVGLDWGGALETHPEWSWRFTALARDSDAQIDEVKDDRLYLAPAVTWSPSAATSLTLLASYQKNERGQGYQALPRVGTLVDAPRGRIPTDRFVGEPDFERFDQERYSLGYAFEQQLGSDWTLRQNFRAMGQETIHNSTFQAGLQADGETIDRLAGQGRERVRNLVIDNQLQWKLSSAGLDQTVLMGLDYQNLRSNAGSLYSPLPTLNVFDPVYGQPLGISADAPPDDTRKKLSQTGLYLQDQLKFNDRIAWTIGGRYDHTKSDTVDIASGVGDPQTDTAFTWRTGGVYLFDNGWAPYAGYAESFTPLVDRGADGKRFEPETGQQFELGIRYQPKGERFSFLAAVYELKRQNVLTNDLQNPDFYIQRGEVRSRGIELEAQASLGSNLDLVASYTHIDLKVTKSNGPDLDKTPSASPKDIASLWASWRVPGWAGTKLSAGARYVGKTWGDEVETISVPGYTLLDAGVEFDLGQVFSTANDWRLGVNVSNLADKTYVATCGYFADGCKYGYRRTAGATMTYRW
jgi:iron complex outermembrane receptor protein